MGTDASHSRPSTIAHVFADTSPGADFEAVQPDLKDVYFSVMAGRHGRGASEGAAIATSGGSAEGGA